MVISTLVLNLRRNARSAGWMQCILMRWSSYIVNSFLSSVTYILPAGNGKDCWLVDCGDVEKVVEAGWNVKGVLLTHSHCDHIYGLNKLIEVFPDALVYTNAEGAKGLKNPRWNFSLYRHEVEDFVFGYPRNVRVIEEEGVVDLGGMRVEVLFVPGHEPSCLAFRVGDELFTGDAYIPGVKVLATLPRSNKRQAAESLERLQRLEALGLKVMPGHWIAE